jgi:hypothetical protein
MAIVRVSAVASLVVSFNFLAAFFALKHWHGNSQHNTTANHNNFARGWLRIKATFCRLLMEPESISSQAKEYSKTLLSSITSHLV